MKSQNDETIDEKNIGICVFMLDQKNKSVLLGKRKNSYRSGYWGAPGGRLGKAESLETACKRELLEETGVKPLDLEYVGVVGEYQEDNDFTFVHFVFLCFFYEGTISCQEPEKCEGWEWHRLNNLPKPLLNGHRLAIDMIARNVSIMDHVPST